MITLPFGSTPYYRVISHRRQEISGVYNALRYLNKKKKLVDDRVRWYTVIMPAMILVSSLVSYHFMYRL